MVKHGNQVWQRSCMSLGITNMIFQQLHCLACWTKRQQMCYLKAFWTALCAKWLERIISKKRLAVQPCSVKAHYNNRCTYLKGIIIIWPRNLTGFQKALDRDSDTAATLNFTRYAVNYRKTNLVPQERGGCWRRAAGSQPACRDSRSPTPPAAGSRRSITARTSLLACVVIDHQPLNWNKESK